MLDFPWSKKIKMANDNDYGLSGYVSGADQDRVNKVAGKLRAGMIHLNGAQMDRTAPFGGYKHSGNGRERGPQGFEECRLAAGHCHRHGGALVTSAAVHIEMWHYPMWIESGAKEAHHAGNMPEMCVCDHG